MPDCAIHACCYCHTCERMFDYLGIASHRAAHRRRREDCTITYSTGKTRFYEYSSLPPRSSQGSSKQADAPER